MPSKNYSQKLTTQRQKSFESHLSSTLMRVKLVFVFMSCLLDDVLSQHSHVLFKVSNGVLLDEYRQNLDALNNSGVLVSREKVQEEIVPSEEMEWVDTKVHLRRSSF